MLSKKDRNVKSNFDVITELATEMNMQLYNSIFWIDRSQEHIKLKYEMSNNNKKKSDFWVWFR